MASEDVASAPQATGKSFKVDSRPPVAKHAAQDIKPSDAEENHNSGSGPGELKRKLKSRHLQMIAIGMSCVLKSGCAHLYGTNDSYQVERLELVRLLVDV